MTRVKQITRTRFNKCEVLGVPEVWRWNGTQLEIHLLIDNKYSNPI